MSALWLKRLVLAAALAVIPLQGVAAALAVLACHGEAQAHAAHQHDGHHDGGAASADNSYHPCCHLTVSAPPAVMLPAALPDFPARSLAPDPLHDLFVPHQPQRPPLA